MTHQKIANAILTVFHISLLEYAAYELGGIWWVVVVYCIWILRPNGWAPFK